MTWDALEVAGADTLRRLGPQALRAIIEHAAASWPGEAILGATPGTEPLLDALASVDRSAALAYLSGLAAGYAHRASEITVETVWSGPGSHHVPVRATAAVLADVVREARHELLLMTYSAKPHQPLTESLRVAIARGVAVSVVVETLAVLCPAKSPTTRSRESRALSYGIGQRPGGPNQVPRCTPSSPPPTGKPCSSPAPTLPSRAFPRT